MSVRSPVGVLGYRGYSGQEIVAILDRHRYAEAVLLEHREAEDRPRPIGHSGPRRIAFSPENVRAEGLAAVFMATPADVSMDLALPVLEAGAQVDDMSAGILLRGPPEISR